MQARMDALFERVRKATPNRRNYWASRFGFACLCRHRAPACTGRLTQVADFRRRMGAALSLLDRKPAPRAATRARRKPSAGDLTSAAQASGQAQLAGIGATEVSGGVPDGERSKGEAPPRADRAVRRCLDRSMGGSHRIVGSAARMCARGTLDATHGRALRGQIGSEHPGAAHGRRQRCARFRATLCSNSRRMRRSPSVKCASSSPSSASNCPRALTTRSEPRRVRRSC